MHARKLILAPLVLMLLVMTACQSQPIFVMKGVGIDIPPEDFVEMKNAGINILTTEWGMEEGVDKAKAFLDKADDTGLKVVLDGGFSYTAWGFTDDDWDHLPRGKRPVWQRDRVQSWVTALKDHPAVFGWDICNEYGENLPSGAAARHSEWPKTATTMEQLKQVRADVLEIDPRKPILIRMYCWDMGESLFQADKPFEAGVADIVMLNLYSNYMEDNQLQWPEMIQDGGIDYVEALKATDPHLRIWIAIAAFEDPSMFQRPTVASLARDFRETLKIPYVEGIAFFQWGPEYLWNSGETWYLPETGADLWQVIQQSIHRCRYSSQP